MPQTYVDETLFGSRGKSRNSESDSVFLSNSDLGRLKDRAKSITIKKPEAVVKKSNYFNVKREDIEEKRYDDWAKKIEAQHERKLDEMRLKKEASDKEKQKLDEDEQRIQEETKKQAIERANKLLLNNDAKVRNFHSALLLSDVVKEREMQTKIRDSRKRTEKEEIEYWLEISRQQDEKEKEELKKKEILKAQRAKETAKMQRQQLEEETARKKKLLEEKKEEDEKILQNIAEFKEQQTQALAEKKRQMKDAYEEIVNANEAQKKMREEQKRAEQLEEERIRKYAEEKDKFEQHRTQEQADVFKGKLSVRQKLIDEQVQNLGQIRAKEQIKYEKEVVEIKHQQEETMREFSEKKKAQLDDVKRVRLIQIKEKEEALKAKVAADKLFLQQTIEAEKKQKEADELTRQKKQEKSKETQQAILQQIAEKQKTKLEDSFQKQMDAEKQKTKLENEKEKFKRYADNKLTNWEEEKKSVVKLALKKIN